MNQGKDFGLKFVKKQKYFYLIHNHNGQILFDLQPSLINVCTSKNNNCLFHYNNLILVANHRLSSYIFLPKILPLIHMNLIIPPFPAQTTTSTSNIGRKLFVGGIKNWMTVARLKQHFSRWGSVQHFMINEINGRRKGFGFVTFERREDARRSVSVMLEFTEYQISLLSLI